MGKTIELVDGDPFSVELSRDLDPFPIKSLGLLQPSNSGSPSSFSGGEPYLLRPRSSA